MIIKKNARYEVIDTTTKKVVSVHEFDDSKKSMIEAEQAARDSNAKWKETKQR